MAGDKTKPRIHLIPSEATLGMAQALTFGVIKHGRYQFRDSDLTHTDIIDSLMRHTLAYLSGEDNDPETGYPHTWHIGANFAMLEWKRIHQPELDDRYKKKELNNKDKNYINNDDKKFLKAISDNYIKQKELKEALDHDKNIKLPRLKKARNAIKSKKNNS